MSVFPGMSAPFTKTAAGLELPDRLQGLAGPELDTPTPAPKLPGMGMGNDPAPQVPQAPQGAPKLPGMGMAAPNTQAPPSALDRLRGAAPQFFMGGEGQGYGKALSQLTQPLSQQGPPAPGGQGNYGVGSAQGLGNNISNAWSALPGAGKAGVIGLPAIAAMMALRRKRRKPGREVQAADTSWEGLRKEQGMGPGHGGPSKNTKQTRRAMTVSNKGTSEQGSCCKSAAAFGAMLARA
jgi:hypothetical protein